MIASLQSLAVTLVGFVFVLTIVVFIHELGHFLVARWCGVAVKVFSIGFGPEIFGFDDRRGTRWRLSAIPLGGYVRFLGDENEASVTDREALERMSPTERQGAFAAKSVGKRAAVVVAGPAANFILAVLIFAAIAFAFGKQVTAPRIDSVKAESAAAAAGFQPGDLVLSINGASVDGFSDVERIVAMSAGRKLDFLIDRGGADVKLSAVPEQRRLPDRFGNQQALGALDVGGPIMPANVVSVEPKSAAAAAGLQAGDRVRSIDGKPIASFADLRDVVSASPGRALDVVVDRHGETVQLRPIPASVEDKDASGAVRQIGQLGIAGGYDPADTRVIKYGILGALGSGIGGTWFIIDNTIDSIVRLITGHVALDQIGGPVRIAQISGQVASLGILPLLNWIAFLSVSIGAMNLLPIPILDGGHLLFYFFEAIRRPLSERVQDIGLRLGLALVITLMVLVLWNDIFGGHPL